MAASTVTPGKVFVPGGQPTFTYNNRPSAGLETAVRNHLDSPHRVLSVTGPTKSGKTVLLKSVLDQESVWVSGGTIGSADEFWSQVAYQLDLDESETGTLTHMESDGSNAGAGLDLKIIKADLRQSTAGAIQRGRSATRQIPQAVAALSRLKERGCVLVVDDFHYLERSVQREIVRGIRPALFEGCPIILVSVPHRTYDAVRAEPEMTGRVSHLQVPLWTSDELHAIGTSGYSELELDVKSAVLNDFVKQAAGSPHLMQDFCLRLCRLNGVEAKGESTSMVLRDREGFYKTAANEAASRVEFDRFLKGLLPRAKRKQRTMRSGDVSIDIYRAVILAIVDSGPGGALSLDAIRTALAKLLKADDVPQRHEVTRVLRVLDDLARSSTDGEPVLEWDEEGLVLHILDPFFSYAVRWIGGFVGV